MSQPEDDDLVPPERIPIEEPMPEEYESGEDLRANMMADYARDPELDRYDEDFVEDGWTEFGDLDPEARRAAERQLDLEDRRGRRFRRSDGRHIPLPGIDDIDDPVYRDMLRARQLQQGLQDLGEDQVVDLVPITTNVQQALEEPATRRTIVTLLHRFLLDGGETHHYREQAEAMMSANKASLIIDYSELQSYGRNELVRDVTSFSRIAEWLFLLPVPMFEIASVACCEFVFGLNRKYQEIHSHITARFSGFDISKRIVDLRVQDSRRLIRTVGVVTKRTEGRLITDRVVFTCTVPECGYSTVPMRMPDIGIADIPPQQLKPRVCAECQARGSMYVNTQLSSFTHMQTMTLQESPENVKAGSTPRSIELTVTGDLVNSAKPGDLIDVTGVFNSKAETSTTSGAAVVFTTTIVANHIVNSVEQATSQLDSATERLYRELSRDPEIHRRIIASIAPAIYGCFEAKAAIAAALFGGVGFENSNQRVRGDIHVLMVGDPGLAKSQLLKAATSLMGRSVFTTGKGASAVGLTAAVTKDPITREFTLEGGALVLADRGICCIDELDKLSERDRTSIHEALEQQTISITKAGIVAKLQARCSVLAAANPIKGRYDPALAITGNVRLGDPILSRFDIILVMRDTFDPDRDRALAQHVIMNHIIGHEEASSDITIRVPTHQGASPIDRELLKGYISYARAHFQPTLGDADKHRLVDLITSMRQTTKYMGGCTLVYWRNLEAMLRVASAFAKMRFSNEISSADVDWAIRLVLGSFIQQQRAGATSRLRMEYARYLTFGQTNHELVLHKLNQLRQIQYQEHRLRLGDPRDIDELAAQRAIRTAVPLLQDSIRHLDIDIRGFFNSDLFRNSGYVLDPENALELESLSTANICKV